MTFQVHRDYLHDGRSAVGRHRYLAFGATLSGELHAGRSVAREDLAGERGMSLDEAASRARLGLGATLHVPVLRHGRLEALLAIHFAHPQALGEDSRRLAEEAAKLAWTSLTHARAEAGAAHQFRATGGDVRPGQRGHRGMRPELALHPGQRSLLRDRRPFARDPARPAHAGHPRPRRLRPPRGARRSDRRGVRDERPLRSPRRRYGVGAEPGHAAGGRAACRQRPALRVHGHQRAGTRRERACANSTKAWKNVSRPCSPSAKAPWRSFTRHARWRWSAS